MKNKIDYNRNLDHHITNLKSFIGNDNAREDLRRFAHHLRNFEYSGEYNNEKSKLLIKAEIIKSIYSLCSASTENLEYIKNILHKIFQLNLKIYDHNISRAVIINMLAEQVSNLDSSNKFSVLIIKAKENYFSVVIEKLFDGLADQDINELSKLLIDICYDNLAKSEIFRRLNKAIKQYQNCPLRIHLIDKNITGKNIINLYDRDKNSNIRVYNFFSSRINTSYSKLYDHSNKIANFLSLNIVYSMSYILAKLNLRVNIESKKIEIIKKSNNNNLIFQDNVKNIIEYTIDRLANEDKFVIGSLDRKFSLNNRVKYHPKELKQINLNELDQEGLLNLKQTVDHRIKLVNKLQNIISNLESNKFDSFIAKYQTLIPQLILDQAKIQRAKAFYQQGLKYDLGHQHDSAIEMYKAAIRLDHKFKEAYLARATNYYQQKLYKKSIEDFSATISLDSYNIKAYHMRGLAYAQLNLLTLAIKDFSFIIELEEKTTNTKSPL